MCSYAMGRWSRIWQKPVSLDPPSRVKLHFSHVPPVGLDLPTRVKSLTAPFSCAFYSIMMRKDLTALEQIPALVIVIVIIIHVNLSIYIYMHIDCESIYMHV